jgi:hypothetical protein
MLLGWGTVNNSINCADIQFSTELELKNPGTDPPFEILVNF